MDIYKIGVIGLGYVGLPLAIAFAEKYKVTALDIDKKRIKDLNSGTDHTQEAEFYQITSLVKRYHEKDTPSGISFTDDPALMRVCNVYIITVPTPVDEFNVPDLTLLKEATKTIACVLKKNDIVIYESTVYPGCTEEIGVPILEQGSGLVFNIDFFVGYSPERINPGDKERTISQIKKITSGSTPETANTVDGLYASIINAGTYLAPSIKVAEAAKVIENTQRDVNIAFVNELAKIFNLLNIDTQEVLKAAGTKWNFIPFQPGLVGGHCIGIDPYYLAHKAMSIGYQPELILAARRINDSMGEYVAQRVMQLMAQNKLLVPDAEVLVLGITFKENFPDVRNSRVIDIVNALKACHLKITIVDPLASQAAVKETYGLISKLSIPPGKRYSAIIVAVNHSSFSAVNYQEYLQESGILYDVKGALTGVISNGRL